MLGCIVTSVSNSGPLPANLRHRGPCADSPSGRVAEGLRNAKPARIFRFEDIQDAHRLMESSDAGGKLVIEI